MFEIPAFQNFAITVNINNNSIPVYPRLRMTCTKVAISITLSLLENSLKVYDKPIHYILASINSYECNENYIILSTKYLLRKNL